MSDLADGATAALRVTCALALLVASAAGVLPPLLARGGASDAPLSNTPAAMRLKAFAGGTMLSVAVLHIIADSFERLGELYEYPWAGVAVIVGILFMFFVERMTLDTLASLEGVKSNGGSKGNGGGLHGAGASRAADSDEESGGPKRGPTAPAHGHAHAHAPGLLLAHPAARKLAMAHLLEVSVLVHSLIIGADLGASPAPRAEVLGFAGVLGVHQFFEGVSLGSVIADLGPSAPYERKLALAAAFSATTPLGVLLGVALAGAVEGAGAGSHARTLAGALDGVTGGMLLHMTLQSFISEEFSRPELAAPERKQLRTEMYALLVTGVSFMGLLAAWA
jgi:zinc transporter 1/2/3